jgi:outer membrane protein OmpA-like peptidoglycan-associated protein
MSPGRPKFGFCAGFAFLSGLVALASTAAAGEGLVEVQASGQSFNGPPALELLVDGKSVADVEINVAPAPVSGKPAPVSAIVARERTYRFTVQDLDQANTIAVAFTNDAAEKGKGDRNLWIGGITVNGQRFNPAHLRIVADASENVGGGILLYSAGRVEVQKPAEGWRNAHGAAGSAALTESGEGPNLKVRAGGQSYNGPPILQVFADDKLVGQAEMTSAPDVVDGKVAATGEVLASMGTYPFVVKDLEKVQKIELRYGNDASNDDSSKGDRNLWIAGIELNGKSYNATDLKISANHSEAYGDAIALYSNGSLELMRPEAGWPQPKVACKLPKTIQLTGFESNSPVLTAQSMAEVKRAIPTLRALRDCSLIIRARTSRAGAPGGLQKLASARAAELLKQLRNAGLSWKDVRVETLTGDRLVEIDVR